MKYFSNRIYIFDLDGVLYYNGIYNVLSKEFCNKNTIIFCTGRGLKRAKEVISHMSFTVPGYIIINNGATILKNDKVIYEKRINKKEIIKILNGLKQLKSIKFINIITSNRNGYQYYDPNNVINDYAYYECNERFLIFEDFMSYCKSNEIIKFTIVFNKINEKELKEINRLNFVKSDENSFCLVKKGINKLTGIEKIINIENYDKKNIVYFGNDYNDYCVFKDKKITSVYVYDVVNKFLKDITKYSVSFYGLNKFLNEEANNI